MKQFKQCFFFIHFFIKRTKMNFTPVYCKNGNCCIQKDNIRYTIYSTKNTTFLYIHDHSGFSSTMLKITVKIHFPILYNWRLYTDYRLGNKKTITIVGIPKSKKPTNHPIKPKSVREITPLVTMISQTSFNFVHV